MLIGGWFGAGPFRWAGPESYRENGAARFAGDGGFDLLFSDVILPDGTGLELARRLTERQPDLRVLVTTGYAGEAVQASRDAGTFYPCLRKPYSISTLLLAIQEAVAH